MPQYRVCPSCGQRNPPEEIMCTKCMANISDVSLVEILEEHEAPRDDSQNQISTDSEKTVVLVETLVLKNEKITITVLSGEVVGRKGKGAEHLASYMTVSRRHARFTKENGVWYVEDLKSTNGTYVNGIKIEQKHPLKDGDTVSLSTLVSFVVEINKRL
uniref:FHA domain-containing protein n=1 Tax=Pseudothermotoga hypogea TaxID=57487 RepID=A0A832MPQ8_9THEM